MGFRTALGAALAVTALGLLTVLTQRSVLRLPLSATEPLQAVGSPAEPLPPAPAAAPGGLATAPEALAGPSPAPVAGGLFVTIPKLDLTLATGDDKVPDVCQGRRAAASDMGELCMRQLWREAGCTVLPHYGTWFRSQSYKGLRAAALLTAQSFLYKHLETCRAGFSRGPSWPELHGQVGQDLWILSRQTVTHQGAPGFYLDIGAHHGNFMSNTRALQDVGWSGICVEPMPMDRFNGRTCILVSAAVVPTQVAGDVVAFQNCEDGRGISGHSRVDSLVGNSHPCKKKYVRALTWAALLESYGHLVPRTGVINGLSLDCEGCELELIRAFPFGRLCVEAWIIENGPKIFPGRTNPNYAALRRFMASKNCSLDVVLGLDQDDGYVCNCAGFLPAA